MPDTNITLGRQQKTVTAKALDVSLEGLGEISVKTSIYKKVSFRSDFSPVFKGNITTLVKMKLTSTLFKIVIYLFSILDYGNILINFSQSKIARELGLCKPNISRIFRELSRRKILLRDVEHDHVYPNSNLCTKGIPRRFNERQMDKPRKPRIDTEDFDDAFNLYYSGRKVKPNRRLVTLLPVDSIPF